MNTITIAGIELPLRQTSQGPVIDEDRLPELEPLGWLVNMAIDRHLARYRELIERGEPVEHSGINAVPVENGQYRISASWLKPTVTLPATSLIEIMTTLTALKLPPKPRVIPEPKEPDPPPPPRVAPPRPEGLGTSWAELEARAAELDRMVERERTDEHLAEEARVRCWLLNDIQDSGLFDRAEYLPDDEDLPTLRGYRAAAKQLAAYLESETRAEWNPDAPPSIMLGSPISVDWYRLPQARIPHHRSPMAWLAECERALTGSLYPEEGERGTIIMNTGFAGWWTLHWRTDDALHPCVYAATTEGDG